MLVLAFSSNRFLRSRSSCPPRIRILASSPQVFDILSGRGCHLSTAMRNPKTQLSSQLNGQKTTNSSSVSILEARRAELQRQEDVMKGGVTYGVATNKHYRSRSFVPEIQSSVDGQGRQEKTES